MTGSSIESVYRASTYCVRLPSGEVELRVDAVSPVIADLIRTRRAEGAAFLTAWNPHSRSQPAAENHARQDALEQALYTLQAVYFHGWSGQGQWREEQILAIGLRREMAMALGERFEQNAILWIEPDGVVRLVMLTPQA